MSPRPSNPRPCPPATAVPPESRNGHARALSPCASARSRCLQRWHARPPTVDYSPSEQPATSYPWRRHLRESNNLLLLFL
jgi:hypothetical protein